MKSLSVKLPANCYIVNDHIVSYQTIVARIDWEIRQIVLLPWAADKIQPSGSNAPTKVITKSRTTDRQIKAIAQLHNLEVIK
jgi:hypothetical protein